MKKIVFASVLLSLSVSIYSCKKKKSIDPCVQNFVGNWNCQINSSGGGGGCGSSGQIEIVPGPAGGCQVLFPGLPDYCQNSGYQVLGTVSGDSIFIVNEPFGLTTLNAEGRVYLNQFTFRMSLANGTVTILAGTK